jgi:DNA-binding MarR family transcriptional regulator/N-acetylglutamate synthase-like GNAT family acetyltransferase
MTAVPQERIAAARRFNRFYTRQIGVLRKNFLDTPYSLAEARVLYAIASGKGPTASEIAAELDLDAGYLSRVLRSFEKQGLIERETSEADGRQSHLRLTARGKRAYAPLEQRSQQNVSDMLGKLPAPDQARVIAAMDEIETLLDGAASKRTYTLREPRHGDFGWIVTRHAQIYADEYGWAAPFEGLCAQIVADFVNNYDARRERCWIAEMNGAPVGCVMLVKDKKPGVARIRLLLVDPKARGLGLGHRLTEECIKFARKAGYRKVTLWTHSILKAARHVYESAGFKLTGSEPHKSWGKPVVSEYYDLEL